MFSKELTQKPKRKQCVYTNESIDKTLEMRIILLKNGVCSELRKVKGVYKLYL